MRNSRARSAAAAAGILAAAALALAGCGSSGGSGSSSAGSSHEVVHLTLTDWDNGMPAVVSVWNKAHPDIQVQLIKPTGTGYTLYNKLITDNRAGTNPDVAEVEYQALPEMVSNHVVIPLDKYLPSLASKYSTAALGQVQFQGKTYGVPQNICPMVFFYRKDLFSKLGLKAPTTWAQYAADAAKIHKANPKRLPGQLRRRRPRVVRRAGPAGRRQLVDHQRRTPGRSRSTTRPPRRWPTTGRAWSSKGVISPEPGFSTQWNTDMNNGTHRWAGSPRSGRRTSCRPSRRSTAGKWVAAPLPAWTAGDQTVGTWGGEAEVVTARLQAPGPGRPVRGVDEQLRRRG